MSAAPTVQDSGSRGPLHDESRFEDADAFYAALADALDDCGEAEALQLLSRLVLLLANEIGRQDVLLAAIGRARSGAADGGPDRQA